MADRIKAQDRNPVRPSRQNRAQQASYRNTALQYPTEMHHTILFSRLRLTFHEVKRPVSNPTCQPLFSVQSTSVKFRSWKRDNHPATSRLPRIVALGALLLFFCAILD